MTQDLIKRLLAFASGPSIFWEAADALNTQAAEIESLQRTLQQETLARENVTAMRDNLRAELAALKAQEPVIDFTILHQFASDQAISYNKLCTAVRMSLTQQKGER
jgi:hypothetical protein